VLGFLYNFITLILSRFITPKIMIGKIIDTLTIIAMIVVIIVFLVELMPIYRAVVSVFSASAYGF